ncbi:hypothetical protein Nepgr_021396 [Nepenthes gracilis]|uniref:Uncharacterized protein n=1 Tax=Nepenthes gracilis TaxID=150966 RepID=A0AAD3SYJ5_NEPGR|nr:hypothetical protein Nepgr_021396 [Nepenthes gracilis]
MPISETSSSSSSASYPLRVQMVSHRKSERLLQKFFDAHEFDFDYEQSALWSPPIRRSVFLSSPGRIFTDHEMAAKLSKVFEESRPGRRKLTTRTRFNPWGCVSLMYSCIPK